MIAMSSQPHIPTISHASCRLAAAYYLLWKYIIPALQL
jgi:hypothetical protein